MSRGLALVLLAGSCLYGLLVAALHVLPLEVIQATPLNYFVTYRLAPALRLRTEVTQLDEFWREVDEFAAERSLRWSLTGPGIKRVNDEYNSDDGYGFGVQMYPGGRTDISFFQLPPKNASLPPIIEDFKRHLPDYSFEIWVDPNDVPQTASAR